MAATKAASVPWKGALPDDDIWAMAYYVKSLIDLKGTREADDRRDKLIAELYNVGIRLDQEPADIAIEQVERGGLEVIFTSKHPRLDEKLVRGILKEYSIFNGTA